MAEETINRIFIPCTVSTQIKSSYLHYIKLQIRSNHTASSADSHYSVHHAEHAQQYALKPGI
jgi:hypothetical protein